MLKDSVICTFVGHILESLTKLLALEEMCPIFPILL